MKEEWTDPGSYVKFESLGIVCPKCKSDDIVLEERDGYLSFLECNKCGYRKEKTKVKANA